MSWDAKFEEYKALWRGKRRSAVEKELSGIRNMLARNADTFFQQSAADELSDGDRVLALKDVLSEKKQ